MTWVCQPRLELAFCTSLPAGLQPWAVLRQLGQLDSSSAGKSEELSLASELLVPGCPHIPLLPPRAPSLPGAQSLLCASPKDRAYFFPTLSRPSLHWRASSLCKLAGLDPLHRGLRGRQKDRAASRAQIEPQIRPVNGWGPGGGGHRDGAGASDLPS